MIELLWKNLSTNHSENLMCITNMLAWLVTTIHQDKEMHNIVLDGYFTILDKEGVFATLLICKGKENQKKLLNILQQPPNEYKEKYIACIHSEEPNPVNEVTDNNSVKKDENIMHPP